MKNIPYQEVLARIFSDPVSASVCCEDDTMTYAEMASEEEAETYTTYEADDCVVFIDDVTYDGRRFLNRTVFQRFSAEEEDSTAVPPSLRIAKELLQADGYQFITVAMAVESPSSEREAHLPPAADALYGWRKYGRYGARVVENPSDCTIDGWNIRELTKTEEDQKAVLAFCAAARKAEDSPYGNGEYENFEWCMENQPVRNMRLFGAWTEADGLIGMVTVALYELKHMKIAQVGDIATRPEFRRRGIGRAMVKAALSVYPEEWYYYNVAKDNQNSIATATSAGFSFIGANLWIKQK